MQVNGRSDNDERRSAVFTADHPPVRSMVWTASRVSTRMQATISPNASQVVDFSVIHSPGQFEICVDYRIDPTWVWDRLHITAFVQSDAIGEILNSCMVRMCDIPCTDPDAPDLERIPAVTAGRSWQPH